MSIRMVLIAALVIPATHGFGYLKKHPSNPHYLQETTTGQAVMITSFTAIVPADSTFDYVTRLRVDTQSRRLDYARVWEFTPWSLNTAIWPWAASGTGGGYWGGLGGNKLNMNTWNTTFWTRMNDAMSRAANAGVYAEIMLFDGVGLEADDGRWGNNPWAANNNINSLEVPNAQPPNAGTTDFYVWSSPNLRNQQERWVRKMIDETIAYPNIIYEVENEHRSPSSSFGSHYAQFIQDYIAATYPSSPRLVSYSTISTDLEDFYTIPAVDIVNRHFGNSAENDPTTMNTYLEPRWSFNKPINVDEFANGVGDATLMRQMCWIIITSGAHFHVEDADPAVVYNAVENIRSFKALANWNFVEAAPNKGLITAGGGYCLAKVGEEYVCYFTTSGSKTLNLAAATYRSEWWNPRTGGFYNVATFSHGGGNLIFTPPDANDWVLHVTTRPALTTVLDSKLAGAITIDGSSADWNLSQYTTKMFAGNAGQGDTAIVGYNGFENWTCYAGGHSSSLQFPPTDAADHAARIYSRHDASFLYFLARVDDSSRQTSNPVASNSSNDCVEIYLDPGHDHGASAMSNSNSDVRLVIDAVNQKNVYNATASYATQVLSGVTSAVTTDSAGWWMEVRIAKNALSPAIPAGGTIGVEFALRDNDSNNNAALTTLYSWHDPEISASFPTRIPDRWGDLNMVAVGQPGLASNPNPPHQATNQSANLTLSWSPGSGATSHDVYLGTTSPGTFVGNQAGTTYGTGPLAQSTTYFWRIDEVNAGGVTTGPVWSFTTGAFSLADLDTDNDVDSSDFAIMQGCFTPVSSIVSGPCTIADLNHDFAVDGNDVVIFLPCMTGANLPPGC